MCRHAAYVGPAVPLTTILWDPPHSLREQARRPKELLVGTTCADGFGIAWLGDGEQIARYAHAMPLWSDVNVEGFGRHVSSGMQLAAIRDATMEGTNQESNCHPFVHDGVAFSHNGALIGFQRHWKPIFMQEWIAPERLEAIRGNTDSEHLLQAILTERDRRQGDPQPLLAAVKEVLIRIHDYAQEHGLKCQLNTITMDRHMVVATRWGNQPQANSLYVGRDWTEAPDGRVVASEPLDSQADWQEVPAGTMVVLQDGAPGIQMQLGDAN